MTQTVLMIGAAFGKVSDAAHHPVASRPSHSDDPYNALGFIGLDAASLSNTRDETTMKP